MIKLEVNNGRTIELTQENPDENIIVEVIDSKGILESAYIITAGDMTMLLNYHQHQKDYGLPIF